jgi:hypothetical protein
MDLAQHALAALASLAEAELRLVAVALRSPAVPQHIVVII